MSKKHELYASIDIETDGQCAGLNNMLTCGIALFDDSATIIDQFYVRILQLPDLQPDPSTMIWWKTQKFDAFMEAFEDNVKDAPDRITAYDAMIQFGVWLTKYPREKFRITPLAWPAAFDFPFIKYYSWRFLGSSPLGWACEDIRSYAHGVTRKKNYYDLKEEELKSLIGVVPGLEGLRDHVAIDDAIGQGKLFFHIRDNVKKVPIENEPTSSPQ